MAKKTKQNKSKSAAKKNATSAKSSRRTPALKGKVGRHAVGAKSAARKAEPKAKAGKNAKAAARKRAARKPETAIGTQSVEAVQLKGRRRSAAAGAGGGDFGGVSIVEDVDSESADELLQEGQAFEAGIVSGVENAPDPDQGEVRTHEVSQDDVPEEYDDKDRP